MKKIPIISGQPLWDKIIMALFSGWLVLIGLDAGRFRWSHMPILLQWAGGYADYARARALQIAPAGLVSRYRPSA